MKKGMKLLKVHQVISFDQSNFAESFINRTTFLRASSNSKIRKAMWKFYNNVLFGKSMQDPDTLAISTTPPVISRHMAFAVGFSILEFAKLEMYQVG